MKKLVSPARLWKDQIEKTAVSRANTERERLAAEIRYRSCPETQLNRHSVSRRRQGLAPMELRRKNNPWLPLLLVSHLLVSVAFSSSWGAHDAPAPADGSHGKGKDKGTHHHETANGTSGDCGRKKHHHHGAGGRDGQRVRGPPAATSNPWIVSPGPPASTAGAAPRPYASEFITAATGVVLVAGGVGWLLVCA